MKEFYIEDDGIRLHAKLEMPAGISGGDAADGDRKCPLVIVMHGLTGHMEETHIRAAAGVFNELGAASLRVEMYGHGRSGGRFEDHNIMKWLNNAMRITDYARSLPFVTDLYICGHSQGGLAAVLLAGMEPEVFRAAIPMSPALMMPEGARSGNMFGISFDPCCVPDEIYVNSRMKVNGNYIRAAQLMDTERALSRYAGPMLFIHGDEDEAVPVSYSTGAAERHSNIKTVIIRGDDHCYNYHLDQVTDAIREFMKEQR